MRYYHIYITEDTGNLYMIILPIGKYHYKHLPMGVANSPDIFQHKINYLFQGFEFIRTYIYDLLILTKQYWTYHVQELEITINKLKESGLKCNI